MCCLNVVIIAPTSTFHNKEVNSRWHAQLGAQWGSEGDKGNDAEWGIRGTENEEKGKPQMCAQNAGFAG